jgi:hypothetical protein
VCVCVCGWVCEFVAYLCFGMLVTRIVACVSRRTHKQTQTHRYRYTRIRKYIHTHTHTHTHSHTHTYIHVYLNTHIHTRTHTHTLTHAYTHAHTHTHTHTHSHTQTHTHTHTSTRRHISTQNSLYVRSFPCPACARRWRAGPWIPLKFPRINEIEIIRVDGVLGVICRLLWSFKQNRAIVVPDAFT